MKCPTCESCEYAQYCGATEIMRKCERHNKKVEQTNEEYLRSCNTEQLADVFFDYRYINSTPQQQLWLSANEDFVKGGIVEWLKQQHHSKE